MAVANSGSVGRGKPTCQLIGTDGNIFALLGRVTSTLKKAGLRKEAGEVSKKIMGCSSYEEALGVLQDYVEVE